MEVYGASPEIKPSSSYLESWMSMRQEEIDTFIETRRLAHAETGGDLRFDAHTCTSTRYVYDTAAHDAAARCDDRRQSCHTGIPA
jgi:hypothetical protein